MIDIITPADLKQRLAANDIPVLLDVRQPEEHAEVNIPGSLLIPLGELADRIDELDHLRDTEVVIYCRSGNRSGQACMILQAHGFTGCRNLQGGMLAW